MTIQQTIKWAKQQLDQQAIGSAVLDVEVLLSYTLKKDRAFLYSHPQYNLTQNQQNRFKKYINCRKNKQPLAYLIGYKEFYGLEFLVNKNVLIPRPETEILVDQCVKLMNTLPKEPAKKNLFIEVGTGSGCISVSVLKNLSIASKKRFIFWAIDISPQALKVAQKNASLHKINQKIKFIQSDLLKKVVRQKTNHPNTQLLKDSNIVIVANLPYLTQLQYRTNPDLHFEPRNSLLGGPNGLKYYKKLLNQIKYITNQQPLSITGLFEIDPGQKTAFYDLIKKTLAVSPTNIEFQKDLSGRTRVVIIKLNQ